MTDQTPPPLGTVAEEAARLIAAMATMTRSSTVSDDQAQGRTEGPAQNSRPYAGAPAHEPSSPDSEPAEGRTDGQHSQGAQSEPPQGAQSEPPQGAQSEPPQGAQSEPPPHQQWAGSNGGRSCSACGGESDGTPVACKLCPLCQGIALLRSVRPETVDRLADLASAMAASLRDVATQTRASGPSEATSGTGKPPDRGRATVQDIHVDDENEGWRT